MSSWQDAIRNLAHYPYSRVMAPAGLIKVRQMLKDGVPPALQVPLDFLFTGHLKPEDRQVVADIECIRQKLARSARNFEVVFPHGADTQRSARQIAFRSSISREWGTFLYLCAKSFGSSTILELGSCAGISGCYLSAAMSCGKFITIEASPSLACVAENNLKQITTRATVINALCEDALPELLSEELKHSVDLVYIDGQHSYEATIDYFERLAPFLRDGSLLIFDDIHWSLGMWQAWLDLRKQANLAYTIDAGRVGVCEWSSTAAFPKNYSLSLFTGWRTRTHPS